MITENFTPAPWKMVHSENDCVIWVVHPQSTLTICVMHGSMDTVAQANAYLIAAAPEMYDALKTLVNTVADHFGVDVDDIGRDYDGSEFFAAEIAKAVSALKKARGEK